MVLLVFLLDTSASMNQRTCLGTTYLDLAKGAVETFLKIRARDANVSRGDRYMLVTYDAPSESVKAGWRENLVTFVKELKNLEGNGMSNLGRALKDTFDLLNMHRLQSGIDNYGMGRNPYYLEPALILLLSDGCSMMDVGGIIPEITLPTHNVLPGGELTKELYRWDQRLFTLNIKIPGFASSVSENLSVLQQEDIPLGNLCEQTGGKLYNVISQKTLMQSMESIAQKFMIPGVTISFEKCGPDPEPMPKEGINTELERENGDEVTITSVAEPLISISNHESMPVVMNGFIPPMYMDAKLTNGSFPHSIPISNDVSKLPNGLLNTTGLLPSPLMMPLMPPLPLHGGMIPGNSMRGILPPPGFPGLITPPIPYSPQNRLLSPSSNDMSPILPLVNGSADDSELIGNLEPPKTEGEDTNATKLPDIPIRGDENTSNSNDNIATPTLPPASKTVWQSQKRIIYVRTNVKGTVGHWPIPEKFWPESSTVKLPPRNSHPVVNFLCTSTEAMAIDNMPFDKYELEPSPLTQYILERKQPNVAWQTFISGSSSDSELGYPFGYLKASTNLQCVNFFVLPYNYTLIMPLLDELFKVHKCKPTAKWRQSFEDYLKTIPSYYSSPLRNALRRMGAPNNLIPDHMDGAMSYSVVSYLKKIKHQAKLEAERLTNHHSHPHCPETIQINVPLSPVFSDGKLNDFKQLLIQKSTAMLNRELKCKNLETTKSSDTDDFKAFLDSGIPLLVDKFQMRSYKNPFDIRRDDVLQQACRMRTNFFHIDTVCSRLHEEDSKHRVSIVQMGNYQEHVIQFKPLREVDPSQVRVHTFGNPFKLKQDQIIAVDEADVNDNMAFGQNLRKRSGGDPVPIPQKNKKRRTDTHPPSRRPLGAPNTPPSPKTLSVMAEVIYKESDKQQDYDLNSKNSENYNETSEYNDIIKDIDSNYDNHMDLTDFKDASKKNTSNINQQLKRLQQLHRNTKDLGDRTDIFNEKFDEINEKQTSSPILSILRTSVEEIDDKENEELAMININEIVMNHTSCHENEKTLNNHSYSSNFPCSTNASPIPSRLFNNIPLPALHDARLQLQRQNSSKIRLAVWQAIRNQSDFQVIFDLVEQLTVSEVAKNLFISDIIAEADRFQLLSLKENLRNLISVKIVLDR